MPLPSIRYFANNRLKIFILLCFGGVLKTKIIVYGVLYGQSASALAQQLGETHGTASKIRETVLRTYPKLRDYIQQVKEDCRQHG